MAGHALCRFEVKPFSHESSEKKRIYLDCLRQYKLQFFMTVAYLKDLS